MIVVAPSSYNIFSHPPPYKEKEGHALLNFTSKVFRSSPLLPIFSPPSLFARDNRLPVILIEWNKPEEIWKKYPSAEPL